MTEIDIIIAGFPRSGNTWLGRLLSDLLDSPYDGDTKFCQTGKGGYHIRKTHMRAEDWDGESKVVFIQRDPRDVACSLMHYRSLPLTDESLKNVILTMTRGPRDRALVAGEMGMYNSFVRGWLTMFVVWTRYEYLHKVPELELNVINRVLIGKKAEYYEENQEVIKRQSFDRWKSQYEHSMWRGKIGTWKEFFKREHGQIITDRIGPLMLDMGYIESLDWWKELQT